LDPVITVSELVDVAEVTPDVVDALARLLPQLSSSAEPVSEDDLAAMVRSDASHVLIARTDGGEIVGSLTLVVFRIPTGVRAWIEDVVVDSSVRGQGVGELLNRFALDLGYRLGSRTVDLTSRPSRVAANALYRKLGFEERETNIYRHNPAADATTRDA
jgi:ribosomal protein S18 acetylase RimI-like enzyme